MNNTPTPGTKKTVAGIQIACFDLCQIIGMEIEERGRRITNAAVHFPVTHAQVKASLEGVQKFAARSLAVIDAAQAEWRKQHDL